MRKNILPLGSLSISDLPPQNSCANTAVSEKQVSLLPGFVSGIRERLGECCCLDEGGAFQLHLKIAYLPVLCLAYEAR